MLIPRCKFVRGTFMVLLLLVANKMRLLRVCTTTRQIRPAIKDSELIWELDRCQHNEMLYIRSKHKKLLGTDYGYFGHCE